MPQAIYNLYYQNQGISSFVKTKLQDEPPQVKLLVAPALRLITQFKAWVNLFKTRYFRGIKLL